MIDHTATSCSALRDKMVSQTVIGGTVQFCLFEQSFDQDSLKMAELYFQSQI